MNRGKAERWLSRYLDGELDARRSALIEAQLANDPALRAQAKAWRAGGERLRGLAGGAPDPARAWGDLRTRIAETRVDESAPGRRMSVFGSPWSWAAAMLVLLLAATGLRVLTRGGGTEANAPVAAREGTADEVVAWAETEVPGASTMVFRDEETGLTVIWLVENERENAEGEHAGS